MQIRSPFNQSGRATSQTAQEAPPRIAINENELSQRWGMSVKTLRRWRQEQLGPIYCKLGARVTYLITEIENFEQRVSRYSTRARVCQLGDQS